MNKDKAQLKKDVFINWEQPQVLSMYFKQIKKARKQLQKWSVNVSDNDIIVRIVDQIYKSDWFLENTMTKWEKPMTTEKHGNSASSLLTKLTLQENNTLKQRVVHRRASTRL